jgi:hypothetical protein
MRAYRWRQRAAGLRLERRWVAGEDDRGAIERVYSDHSLLDARSLAMHCVIARKVARDPSLLDVARRNLSAWKMARAGLAPHFLHEWSRLLTRPLTEILGFITSSDEVSTRLRQSSPFAGVLTAQQRKAIFDAFRA